MKKVFLFLSLMCLVVMSYSQDSLKLTELSPILITAVRADSKIPVTQHTYGDTDIQTGYQGQEIPMLFSSLPSMYTNSDGGASNGYSYFALRGIDQTRINVTLNNCPLNESEDMGVYTSNYPSFINAVQSMQIQRGVGTSTNGSSSFGGSINFQTKSGLNKGTEIQLGSGAFNTQRFNISTSTGLSKHNLALFANVGGLTTDGFRENSGSHGGSIFISSGYYTKALISKISLFSGTSENKQAWQGGTDSTLAKNYRYNPRANDNPDHFVQTNIQWQTIATFNPRVKFTTTLFYNHLKGNYDVFNLKDTAINGYFAHENQRSDWIGYIVQLDYRYQRFKAIASVSENFYSRYHDGYELFGSYTPISYQNYGNKNETSAFVKLSYDAHKLFYYIDLQSRSTNYSYVGNDTSFVRIWNFINPKVGLKLYINPRLNLYFSSAISHREPTRTSVMFQGNLHYVTGMFTDAKPEQVWDNELGINYNVKKLKLQANVYSMSFQNEFIPTGIDGNSSLPILINVNRSLRYGLEVDADYFLADNLDYNFNVNLSNNSIGSLPVYSTDSTGKLDTTILHNSNYLFNPNVIINHSLNYSLGNITLSINHSYISEVYIDVENKFTLPVVSVFGLNIGYTYKRFNLTVQGNNLTGQKTYSNGYVLNNLRYRYGNALTNFSTTLRIKL